MSCEEFTTWEAFDRIEPIGAERLDYLAALIIYAVMTAAGGKPEFVVPFQERPEQSVEEMQAALAAATAAGPRPPVL